MGRPKLSKEVQMERLKTLVHLLKYKFGAGPYTRKQLEEAAGKNVVGLTLFTSKKNGNGKLTRLAHGLYQIPPTWNMTPPWGIEKKS